MTRHLVVPIPAEVAHAVRTTLRAPEFAHPVVWEVAKGTGPCRVCLEQFEVDRDERLLFTYRPPSRDGTLGAPGPVFIHAHECPVHQGTGFPDGLRSLPLLLEARASGNRIVRAIAVTGDAIDAAAALLLSLPEVEYLHIRHGEAGCFIARVEPVTVGADPERARVSPTLAAPAPTASR